MTISELLAESLDIADQLDLISRGLDSNIYRLESATDRGALSNLQRACHDTANVLRRPRHFTEIPH
jgi:hypothetical protein